MKRVQQLFYLLIFCIVCFNSCQKQSFLLPPISTNSKYPNLTETDRGLAIVWYEQIINGYAIKWSEFNGRSWSKPIIVTSEKEYFVNWADFPSIFYNGKNHFVVHWLEKNGDGTYDYVVKVSQSFDRGKSWSSPIIPHTDKKLGEHGFVSFFNASNNKVGLVWLDGRNMMGEDDGHGYGQMNLYSTTIDKDGILGQEILLDNRVCECCPTSAVNIQNDILVAYRDRTLDEIRNINIVRWNNSSWQTPKTLHNDNWKIAGCPVNGPKLAVRENNIAAVWYTTPEENPIIYLSFSKDGGNIFDSPIRIDNGNPIGRVDCIWLDNDRVLVSWMEMGKKSTNILFSVVSMENDNSTPIIVTRILPERSSGHPVISRYRDSIFLAWTENNTILSKWIYADELK